MGVGAVVAVVAAVAGSAVQANVQKKAAQGAANAQRQAAEREARAAEEAAAAQQKAIEAEQQARELENKQQQQARRRSEAQARRQERQQRAALLNRGITAGGAGASALSGGIQGLQNQLQSNLGFSTQFQALEDQRVNFVNQANQFKTDAARIANLGAAEANQIRAQGTFSGISPFGQTLAAAGQVGLALAG